MNSKFLKFVILFLKLNFLVINKCNSIQVPVEGLCGYPGKPEKSYLSEEKSVYTESEKVFFYCENALIDMVQTKTCTNGTWIGTQPVCGKKYINVNFKKL